MLTLVSNGEKTPLFPASEIALPGRHNVENYMAAILAVAPFVSPDTIAKVAHTFEGVEHRLQFVRELDGVRYYNSSIDSSPNRTKAALSVFSQKVILICGGKDKGIPYDELGPSLVDHVKILLLTGMTADKIEQSLFDECARRKIDNPVKVFRYEKYPELVRRRVRWPNRGYCAALSCQHQFRPVPQLYGARESVLPPCSGTEVRIGK